MDDEELRKQLERELLAQPLPEDNISGNYKTVLKKTAGFIKKEYVKDPSAMIAKTVIIVSILTIGILISMIFFLCRTNKTMQGQTQGVSSESQYNISQNSAAITSGTQINHYHMSTILQESEPLDMKIQIQDKIYTLPCPLQEMESNGGILIALGTQPPADDVRLSPKQRSGIIQFGDDRYQIVLYNGLETTYHDLMVIGIDFTTENQGASYYCAGGILIGDSEQAITDKDFQLKKDEENRLYYYYGNTEVIAGKKTGKEYIYITNGLGIIEKISLFSDGSVPQ